MAYTDLMDVRQANKLRKEYLAYVQGMPLIPSFEQWHQNIYKRPPLGRNR